MTIGVSGAENFAALSRRLPTSARARGIERRARDGAARDDVDGVVLEALAATIDDRADRGRDVERHALQREVAELDARRVEEVVRHLSEATRVAPDVLDRRPRAVHVVAAALAPEERDVEEDRLDRIAEVVGDDGRERLAEAIELLLRQTSSILVTAPAIPPSRSCSGDAVMTTGTCVPSGRSRRYSTSATRSPMSARLDGSSARVTALPSG